MNNRILHIMVLMAMLLSASSAFAFEEGHSTYGAALVKEGRNSLPWRGHAMYWCDNAKAKGISCDTTPKVGSIAVWNNKQIGNQYGHVAVVLQVEPKMMVLAMNDKLQNKELGKYRVRSADHKKPWRYIHYKEDKLLPPKGTVVYDSDNFLDKLKPRISNLKYDKSVFAGNRVNVSWRSNVSNALVSINMVDRDGKSVSSTEMDSRRTSESLPIDSHQMSGKYRLRVVNAKDRSNTLIGTVDIKRDVNLSSNQCDSKFEVVVALLSTDCLEDTIKLLACVQKSTVFEVKREWLKSQSYSGCDGKKYDAMRQALLKSSEEYSGRTRNKSKLSQMLKPSDNFCRQYLSK